jgi:uncharacterized surface protein with fasciclin (FAS1) repeats
MHNVMRLLLVGTLALAGCNKKKNDAPAPAPAPAAKAAPAADMVPPMDPKNIVSIAIGSKDHTTLVAAAKQAGYVTGLANPGPLTVFAPTNAAFAALPPGTVDDLMKPENQAKLQDILKYHVIPSVYDVNTLTDGRVLGMVNGGKVTIKVAGQEITVNGAKILATIKASNGIIHVIDHVLVPPAT